MLVAITDREKSREAFDLLCSTLANIRGEKFTCYVGRRKDRKDEVTWHPDEEIWTLLLEKPRSEDRENYFWCAYGLQNPKRYNTLNIALEINPPHEGCNSRLGGMFAKDINGNIYLCHTGKIRGVGKERFWEVYRGDSLEVDDGAGKSVRVISLGQIDNTKLLIRIKRLISEVKRIKGGAAATSSVPGKFTPEFSGKKSSYSFTGNIEATADHGLVVDELSTAVKIAGHEPFNDQQRDLFVTGRNGQMTTLFEVKTDVSTTSIYQAVGQLMLNGYAQQPEVEKVLVIPQKPTKETEQALKKLRIKVLTYNWKANKPVISSLDGLLP